MSLNGTYDPENIFAKILRGDIPAAKVFEDENIFVLMDAFPQSQGHTLVIPKTGGRNLLDTDEKDVVQVIKGVKRVTEAVNHAFAPAGIVVTQFNGEAAGQTVFHLHFHIIPRYTDQSLHRHGEVKMADFTVLQQQASRIASKLK
jgi:histidine triad (HIT) family protein